MGLTGVGRFKTLSKGTNFFTLYLLTVSEYQKLDKENIQTNSWMDIPFRTSTTSRPSPTQEICELQIAGVAPYKGSATTCLVLYCSLEIIWLRP